MSTITLSAPAVKSSRTRRPVVMHPLTPAVQAPRPFGVGIIPQTRAEKLAASSARLAVLEAEHQAEARVAGVGQAELDRAYWTGFRLGLDGVEAIADRALTFLERKSFREGHEAGLEESCEGFAADAWQVSGFETVEDAEYHDMGCDAPSVPYAFN